MNVFIKREYDLALRICAYLAGCYQQGPISISEVSRKLFITRPFANKIVHRLKNNGIITTVQGKQGGIYLNPDPKQLSLFDVLQAMGFNSTLNECVLKPQICPLSATCRIHNFFVEQEEYLMSQLKTRKVADFAFTDEDLAVHK